ncbi:MAG TPA: hypothetical protein PLN86_15820 [Candidatus Hydrogenedentes bacterium]|nr:hypothetical protein [Candidatus Hydrogenedentota bacterium]
MTERSTQSEPPQKYRRLTRSVSQMGLLVPVRHSLWDAGDHLIVMRTSDYRETSRRLYYKDIQALSCSPTLTRWRVNAVCMAGLLFTFLVLWGIGTYGYSPLEPPTLYLTLALVTPWLAVLIINSARGPTCICHVHTAVQSTELGSVRRLRVARRVFREIRERIENVQGKLDPTEAVAYLRERIAPPVRSSSTRSIRLYQGGRHATAFALMLVLSGVYLMGSQFPEWKWVSVLASACFLIMVSVLLLALASQRNTSMPLWLQTYTWIALVLGSITVMVFEGYLNLFLALGLPMTDETTLSFQESFTGFYGIAAFVWAVLGMVGMSGVLLHRVTALGAGVESNAGEKR